MPWRRRSASAPDGSTSSPSAVPARTFAARSPCWRSGSGELFASAFPRQGIEWTVGAVGGPRVLGVAELERVRDALAARLREAQAELGRRGEVEEQNRGLVEAMIAEPQRYRWVRVSNEDVGEPGCRHWHSRPRWGILGMLMGWWRVKLSSGCPLAKGLRPLQTGASRPSSIADEQEAPQAPSAARAAGETPAAEPAAAKARRPPAGAARASARRATAGALGLVSAGRAGRLGRDRDAVGGFVVQGEQGAGDDRGRARARGPGRARAVDSRALRRLPLAHPGARRARSRSPCWRRSPFSPGARSGSRWRSRPRVAVFALAAWALTRAFRRRSGQAFKVR